jgi:hypothetical protein
MRANSRWWRAGTASGPASQRGAIEHTLTIDDQNVDRVSAVEVTRKTMGHCLGPAALAVPGRSQHKDHSSAVPITVPTEPTIHSRPVKHALLACSGLQCEAK